MLKFPSTPSAPRAMLLLLLASAPVAGALAQVRPITAPPVAAAPGRPGETPLAAVPFADRHKLSILLNPFGFIAGNFLLDVNYAFTPKLSGHVTGGLGFGDRNTFHNIQNFSNLYGEVQLRYFPLATAPAGFYGAPYILAKSSTFDADRYNTGGGNAGVRNGRASNIGFGVVLGGQVPIRNVVMLDFFAGGGPHTSGGDYGLLNNNVFDSYSRGMHLHAGFSAGIMIK